MGKGAPSVYLFYGDDEYSLAQEISTMRNKLGDRAAAEMNTSILDGRHTPLSELEAVVNTVPFLAPRRLIVLNDPLESLKQPARREKFLDLLGSLPEKTALVIRISKNLPSDHWLLRWAQSNRERSYVRQYNLSEGGDMTRWIQNLAKQEGGTFSPQAAFSLASLVGTNKRFASQEINKLLAYVNYARPVEVDDVEYLVSATDRGDVSQVFQMVDALGNQDMRTAIDQLHHLLNQRDPLSLFGMIVRQFRLILLAREIAESGGGADQVQEHLRLHPYVARKVLTQARNFNLVTLEKIYRHLLDLDEAIKTGQITGETALDLLIANLTPQSSS